MLKILPKFGSLELIEKLLQLDRTVQSCKRADKYGSETKNISPNWKSNLKSKPGPKSPKIRLDLKNVVGYCLYKYIVVYS